MNEEAIKDAYNLFVGTGYKKSYEEFKQLIASNPEALNDAYGLFVKTGYTKDINSFKTLMGVGGGTAQPQEDLKKKEESVTTGSPSDDSSSASQKPIKYDFTNLGKPKDPNEALGIKQVKDVDFAAIAQKEKEREAQKPEFYRSLEKDINPSLMQKTEEVAVPEMQYKFGPLGFKFEEWDPGSNTMRVTAPDGKSQEYVRLKDNDPEEMRKLQRFIDENTNVPGLKSLEKQYAEENKKFNTDEEVSAALKSVTDRVTVLNKDVTGFLGEKKLLDEEKELIESVPAVDRNTPQYKQRLAEYNAKATALETKMKDIVFREDQIKADAVKLEKAVGKYTSMKAEQGSWPGGLLDSFMRGIGKISAGEVNAGIDVMFSKYTLGVDEDTISSEVSESKATGDPLQDAKEGGVAVSNAYRINEIYNRATEEQRAKGVEEKYMTVPVGTPSPIPMPSAGQSYKDWWNSLSPDQREAIVDKSNDDIKKDLKVNLLPAMRTGAEIVMGDPNTTVQWADLKKQGFWGGAILGVTESLPAMIGANTTMGWAQRMAAMYAQTTDAVYEEMSKNPAFDDISESEKLSVLAPIGITGAALESIGLRNLVSNKGLMNRIILGAVGRAGATTTAKTFGELVENEVDSMIARGLITASGAMLAEAETGAAQQISEYAYKEIYNAVKGKDMFQTPDFLSAEYIKDVAVAGAQEAVGGFVLGVPSAVSAAYQKKGFLSMDDAQFEFFRAAANDEKIESAYVAKLKQNVVTGKTTIKEAKEALNNYRNSVGLYRSVPEELSTQDAKEAMNLLREKRELEKQKEGKDEALVKRQTNRITEINSRLEELSSRSTEDATAPEAPSAPSGNRIQVLTDEEEERRLSLEQGIGRAMSSTPDGLDPLSVLVDGDLMSFQDAQQELQTLNEKANAIQEPSTESVLSREQGETAEAGGERGQMGQGVQGQEVTQEGGQEKVEAPQSAEPMTESLRQDFTARIESAPAEDRANSFFMAEDGTETPVMGNEKMLVDLYMDASLIPERDRTDQQQNVVDVFSSYIDTAQPKQEEKIESTQGREAAKAKVDAVAEKIKAVLKPKGIQGIDVKKQGIGSDELVDLVAAGVKAMIDAGYTAKEALDYILESIKGDVDQADIDRIRKSMEGATSPEIDTLDQPVTSIPGYDRMMSEVDGIVTKSKSRGRSKSETAKNVMEYMMGSAVYEKATDVQRDQMVRDINERFGISMKSAPSVGKLFGTIKDVKKITMSEKQLLKKQIRDLARGAKDAKVAAAKITDMLTRSIKAMSLSGTVTSKQVSSVIRRFGKVNVFSQESIDKFVEYMANVFEDANYDEKISAARKLSKKAKANIKTKIGASDSIASDLRKIFSINPLLIPAEVMDRYMELLESFGASSAVLSLENINEVKDALSDIFKAINNEVSAVASLSSRFEYYEDKVFTKDGKLLYTETIDQMLEQGAITKEDYDLMSKYRSEISPAERESMTEEEIEAAKKEVIQGILSERIDPRELSLDDEVNLARKISQLLDRYLLERMTLNQLKNLEKLIGVINNGYMPGAAQVLYQELLSTKESLVLDEAVSEAKPLSLTKMYSNLKSKLTRKDATLEMIRRNPLFFIDQLFGDFKTKRIFDSVFSRLAQAQSAFESSIGRVNKRLDIAHDEVAKSFGYKANETIMSSFKMMTYMLQLEYETNPESNQVNPAAAYLKETIKYLESKGTKVSNREADMLREILKHYSSYGEIDAKKLYQSFNSAEKKAIAEVQDINKSLEEKASYTAAVIRGKRIDPLNNYIHHFSRGAFSSDDNASATELANIYNASMNPSTKAMNLMERQKKPTPISFDLFASAQRGAKFTLLDYHMTEPLRVAKITVNKTSKMIESNDGTDLQKQIINAVSAALSESASNVLINNFVSDSLTEMIINYISKQGYRAVLASAPRFVAELSSNIAFATIVDPKSFSEGVKYKDIIMSPLAVMVMDNVKSKSTTRLFHGDTLSGRFIDRSILSQSSGVKSAKPVSVAEEKANMIYNMSLKKYKNFVELVSDALISTPDKMVMRPIWFGSFATEFKRQTGKDVDFNKIAEADSDYMNDNAEAIESAREYADGRSVMAGASDNAFMGILKGTVKPDQGAFVRAFNNFNNFMTRFTIYEYITARQGLYAAMGDGSISRKEGVAMVAGVTTRMTVYTLLSGILGNAMLSMFADEEEDDEKTFMQKFSQALSSAMVSLVVGRDFGNATKSVLNYGVEELNEEFLTGLRNGDYDPYKDAISFSVIPRDKGDQRFDAADLMARMSGSFGPTVKTSVLMMKKMSEPEKKEADAIARSEDEKNIRIPLEVLGNAGLVPLYKDIRKIVMKEMYKELENADKKAADKKQAEKEMLHGYENKTEMKRYNPELYEEVFGEGSPGYNEAQAKKNIKKEKEKLERQMKDDFYNYQPNKKSSNAFGSKDFGKGKDKESKSFGSKKFGE